MVDGVYHLWLSAHEYHSRSGGGYSRRGCRAWLGERSDVHMEKAPCLLLLGAHGFMTTVLGTDRYR